MTLLRDQLHNHLAMSKTHLEFNRLLEKLPAAAYTCNADGLITYYNERAVELWGREPKLNDSVDRFCGSFRLFSTTGTPIPHEQCWMALALRDDKAYAECEIVIERPDGSRRTVLAYANPFHDEHDRLVGAVNVLVDISDRKRAEILRSRLAAIIDSSDDVIISKNLDGVIQTWNDAAQRLFGYTAEQAVGRHISFLIPPDRADEEDRILARLRAGERIYHFDTVRVRSDGQPIHVSVTISPIRDDTGRIIGASKIVRDISDRKRAEDQIYALLTQLKESDRCKDEFLATLAHELRGPLAPLCTMLDLIKHGDVNGALLAQVRATMERQLGQMVRLVDDLLDVSRIRSNKLVLKMDRVTLAPIIRQALEVCRPLAQSARHQLSVSVPFEEIELHADRARLVQVFSNLLNNACKYTDEGGSIAIVAERQGSDVVVKVKDTGIGIPADKLAAVFEIYSQGAFERSRGGLGIGLTVVKRLVELHGGSVSVHSDGPGRGSEFVVRLPALAPKQSDEQLRLLTEMRESARAHRILVVDDNADSAASLAALLEMSGSVTATAHDGLAAVALAERFRPDVVLLDISLPKLDGNDAARRIRELPGGKDMLLVALTGWGKEEDRRRSKEAGFDEHMIKPVDYDALMRLLARV